MIAKILLCLFKYGQFLMELLFLKVKNSFNISKSSIISNLVQKNIKTKQLEFFLNEEEIHFFNSNFTNIECENKLAIDILQQTHNYSTHFKITNFSLIDMKEHLQVIIQKRIEAINSIVSEYEFLKMIEYIYQSSYALLQFNDDSLNDFSNYISKYVIPILSEINMLFSRIKILYDEKIYQDFPTMKDETRKELLINFCAYQFMDQNLDQKKMKKKASNMQMQYLLHICSNLFMRSYIQNNNNLHNYYESIVLSKYPISEQFRHILFFESSLNVRIRLAYLKVYSYMSKEHNQLNQSLLNQKLILPQFDQINIVSKKFKLSKILVENT